MDWNRLNQIEKSLMVIDDGRLLPLPIIEFINLMALSMLEDKPLTQNEIIDGIAPLNTNLNSLSISNLGNNTTQFNFIDQICHQYQLLERVTFAEYKKKFGSAMREPGKSYLYWPSAKGIEVWLLILALPWNELSYFMIKFQGDKQLAKSAPLGALGMKHESILKMINSKNKTALKLITGHTNMLSHAFKRQKFENDDLITYITSKRYLQRTEYFKLSIAQQVEAFEFFYLRKSSYIMSAESNFKKIGNKVFQTQENKIDTTAIKNLMDLLSR
jgi:hypothetical protein